MNTKENFLSDMKSGKTIKISLMVMKIIFKDSDKIVCILADKSGEIKANIPSKDGDIKEGRVIEIEGIKDGKLDVKEYEFISNYEISDYLPTLNMSIEEIVEEIQVYTDKYIISREGKALNDYFFKDEEFLDKFKRGIGGVSIHQNPSFYSEDFTMRIKGCIIQHHGKLEYGSPREMKMEESFIVNFADSIDATMNKISQIKDKTEPGSWSEYDRRIETKLYL